MHRSWQAPGPQRFRQPLGCLPQDERWTPRTDVFRVVRTVALAVWKRHRWKPRTRNGRQDRQRCVLDRKYPLLSHSSCALVLVLPCNGLQLFEQKRLLDEEAKAVEDAEAALRRDRDQCVSATGFACMMPFLLEFTWGHSTWDASLMQVRTQSRRGVGPSSTA